MKTYFPTTDYKPSSHRSRYSISSKSAYQSDYSNTLVSETTNDLINIKHKLKNFQAKIRTDSNNLNQHILRYKTIDLEPYRDSNYFNTKLRQDRVNLQIRQTKMKFSKYIPTESLYEKIYLNTDFSTHYIKTDSVNIKPITNDEDSLLDDIVDDIISIRDKTLPHEEDKNCDNSVKIIKDSKKTKGIDLYSNNHNDILEFINEYENELKMPQAPKLRHIDSLNFQSKSFKKNSIHSKLDLIEDNCRYVPNSDRMEVNDGNDIIDEQELSHEVYSGTVDEEMNLSSPEKPEKKETQRSEYTSENKPEDNNIVVEDDKYENNICKVINDSKDIYPKSPVKKSIGNMSVTNQDNLISSRSNKSDHQTNEGITNNLNQNLKYSNEVFTPERLTKANFREDSHEDDECQDDSYIINEIIKNSQLRFSASKDDPYKLNSPIILSPKPHNESPNPKHKAIIMITEESEKPDKKRVSFCNDLTYIGYFENFNIKNLLIIDSDGNILKEESHNRKRYKPNINKSFDIKPIIKPVEIIRKIKRNFWHRTMTILETVQKNKKFVQEIESTKKEGNLYKRVRMPTPRKIRKIQFVKKLFTSNPNKMIKQPLGLDMNLINNNGISEFSTNDDYRYKRSNSLNPEKLSLLIGNLDIKSNDEYKVNEKGKFDEDVDPVKNLSF